MGSTRRSGAGAQRLFKVLLAFTLLVGLNGVFQAASLVKSSVTTVNAAADPVIAAAGDIACDPTSASFNGGSGTSNNCRQKYTSDLLVNAGLAAVLDLGDNQYYCGGYQAFLQSYDLSWGRVKAITHPSVGNHEYLTSGGTDCSASGAAGYYQYFGSAAGDPTKGYYSFNVGAWHLIALNTQCSQVGGCGSSSPQGVWLTNDLNAHPNQCILAYWHIPLFSSGGRANNNSLSFWNTLYAHHADLVLDGHDHIYERFAPQTPGGALDTANGIREITVGTGGSDHTSITTIAANSLVRDASTYGVLKLTLHSASYDWQFVPEAGKTFSDSGTAACHNATASTGDTTAPSAPSGLAATSVAYNQVSLGWTASSDNVGVAGYNILRNSAKIATSTTTAYTDTTVQPQTSYTYTVTAYDAAGNVSGPSNTINVTTPAGPAPSPTPTATPAPAASLTFSPSADAFVDANRPNRNFGSFNRLTTVSSPTRNLYLKFTVSGVGARTVTGARLRLYCIDTSPFGGDLRPVTTITWTESGITWNTAPPPGATSLGKLGAVTSGSWYELDVSSLVKGDGTYSFAALSTSADSAGYSSKEGAAPPQLIVTLGP